MLDPRLNHLVAAARNGSFLAAARVVGVTQSAVTKSVADLEKEIGYAIFNRTARGVVLTERGTYFAERAAMLLEDARDLMAPDERQRDLYGGVLRIGVCPASLEWFLVEPLARLRQRQPGLRFELSGASFDRTIQQLRSGALDVAIGLEAGFAEWTDLALDIVGSLEGSPFVRRGHPLLDISNPTGADLARYEFVAPSESRPYGEVIRDLYTRHGIAWQSRVHVVDYFPVVRRFVATSDAIGVVLDAYAANLSFQEQFSPLPHAKLFPPAPLCCAVRARWEPKPATRALIAIMRASAEG